jgi:calreticulin
MKPDDWDDDEDDGWEPAEIPNPAYKGPWTQRKIPNPVYNGPWVHPKIPNPEYVPNTTIYKQVSGANVIGFELWNFDSGVLFDNIIVSDEWSFTDEL